MKIRQNSVFLSQLAKDVARGVLVPAAFQRPYVWTSSDVLAMCDSILEGFPLGGFLTWIPARSVNLENVARGRLGPIIAQEGPGVERLLLDGQNRLATIAWMLKDEGASTPAGLSPAESATWAGRERLVVDLAQKRLLFVPAAEADAGFRLPAFCAFGSVNPIVRHRWDAEWRDIPEAERNEGLTWFDRACDAFRDARVVETVMENGTVAEAKRAFLHICRVGVAMSEADFDAATRWADEEVAHG